MTIVFVIFVFITITNFGFLTYNTRCFDKENRAMQSILYVELCHDLESLDYSQRVDIYAERSSAFLFATIVSLLCMLVSLALLLTQRALRGGTNIIYRKRMEKICVISVLVCAASQALFQIGLVYFSFGKDIFGAFLFAVSIAAFWISVFAAPVAFTSILAVGVYRFKHRSIKQ